MKHREIQYKHNNEYKFLQIPSETVHNITLDSSSPHFDISHVPFPYKEELEKVLENHKKLFATSLSEIGLIKGVQHEIETEGPPTAVPLRRTPHFLNPIIKQNIDELLKYGIIRESTSPYASAIVMAPKKTGDLRFCLDFRLLNRQTKQFRYPLPHVHTVLDGLAGSKYFSVCDAMAGYWGIEIAEKDRYKTSFLSEFGSFEFNRMAMGLINSGSTYQRALNHILRDTLYKFCIVYIDDIIIFSKSIEEHIKHLNIVLNLLENAGVKLKFSKCFILQASVELLGHVVSAAGVAVNPKKIESIRNIPVPKNIKELLSFLGSANYYHRFVKNYSDIAHSLLVLTKKNVPWTWGEKEQKSFDELKLKLTTSPILRYPDFSREFIIITDASQTGVGAVLAQFFRYFKERRRKREYKIPGQEEK